MTSWISRARKRLDSVGSARSQTSAVTASRTSNDPDVSPGDLPRGEFVVPIGEGADPSVVRDGDRYLWCLAEGNVGISIWVSDRLTSLGVKHVIWMAEPDGPCSQEVWAPELHRIDGRWHIYFAASDGKNRNHRTFVLVADTDDPTGSYTLHGPLFTGDEPGGDNLWSIDFTVLQHEGRLYGLWSGWPDLDTDLQHLYAAEMSSPTEIKSGRVRLLEAGTFDWQRVDETPR
jgi:GH43 family beta-xylosidase